MTKIEPLNVDDFFPTESDYNKAKAEYIASYKVYVPGTYGFFYSRSGYEEHRPQEGEAKWNSYFPKGFDDWRNQEFYVNYEDAKKIEAKINEIIKAITK